MKRFALTLALLLACIAPASAVTLLSVSVTTAVTAQVGPTLQVRNTQGNWPLNLAVQSNFTYGSGGTTVNWWLQTSYDGGTTWCDVSTQALTTSGSHQVANVSATATVALAACTDGAGSGVAAFGNLFRVKYTTTGTYAGGTTLRIDVVGNGLTSP